MKKITALLLTLFLVVAVPLSASAASVSVATELTHVRSYYTDKNELTLFEETLALASMGMLTGKTAFLPEHDGTAGSLAKRILAVSATGELPENDPDPAALKNLQNTDGAFGNLETHCLSILALTGRKEIYNSEKAYQWLMQQQRENGSFPGSVKDTALAICALSLSENEAEIAAMADAVKYLANYEATNAVDLCWQIIGITDGGVDANTAGDRDLLETLLSYQNPSDYSFYRSTNDTKSDPEATAMALAALDTVNEDSSMFQRLAKEGKLVFFDPKDAKPLIIFGAVLLVISITFWGYIFAHKKSTKTLEETKTY